MRSLLTVCTSVHQTETMDFATLEAEFRERCTFDACPRDVRLKIAAEPLAAIVVGRLRAVEPGAPVDQAIVAKGRFLYEFSTNNVTYHREVPVRDSARVSWCLNDLTHLRVRISSLVVQCSNLTHGMCCQSLNITGPRSISYSTFVGP